MPIIQRLPKKNLWESICKEYETKNIDEENKQDIIEYDPAKHSPVFFGYDFQYSKLDDETLLKDFETTISNPIAYGYSIELYKPKEKKEKIFDKSLEPKILSEREYVEQVIFPVLLPSLEMMLAQAKLHKCFERKRTAFNACDFVTEFLYKNNQFKSKEELSQRKSLTFWNIPFVKEWLILHPRPPLPKSLLWSEDEAAVKIQSFIRGYLVRRDPEVQELRKWQRELREENQNIVQRVERFWSDTSPINNSIKGKQNLPIDRSSSLSVK